MATPPSVLSRIAQPFFSGKATDKLAPVDVYQTDDPAVRSNYVSKITEFGKGLGDTLGKQNRLLGDIGKAVKGESIDLASARRMLNGTLNGSKGALDSLTGGLQRQVLGDIGKSITGKPIRIDARDKTFDLGFGSLDDVQGITDMLYDITGTELFKVANLGAEGAIFRSALEMVSAWGIPELVDDVLQSIKDEKERRKIASRAAYNVVNTADIDSIETFMNAVGPTALLALYPDIPRSILQQYRFKAETTPAKYPTLLIQLVRVMDKLKPNWFWTQRGAENVWNLSLINTASDAARLLLMTSDTYRTPVLMAPSYPSRAVTVLMRTMYPLIALRS